MKSSVRKNAQKKLDAEKDKLAKAIRIWVNQSQFGSIRKAANHIGEHHATLSRIVSGDKKNISWDKLYLIALLAGNEVRVTPSVRITG